MCACRECRRGEKPRSSNSPKPPESGFGFLSYALDSLSAIADSRRGGRPGYLPRAMFRTFCLKYLLAERYTVGLIERLHSSPRFREICGFGDAVPSDATFSRFFRLLADIDGFADCAMAEMVENLRERLLDVGERMAVDSTDIEAYANPNRSEPNDHDANSSNWGVCSYNGNVSWYVNPFHALHQT